MFSRGQKTIHNSIKTLEAALLHSSTHSMIFAEDSVMSYYLTHLQIHSVLDIEKFRQEQSRKKEKRDKGLSN